MSNRTYLGQNAFKAAHDDLIEEMANNAKQLEDVIAQKNEELLQKDATIAELTEANNKLGEIHKDLRLENETLLTAVNLLQEKLAKPVKTVMTLGNPDRKSVV